MRRLWVPVSINLSRVSASSFSIGVPARPLAVCLLAVRREVTFPIYVSLLPGGRRKAASKMPYSMLIGMFHKHSFRFLQSILHFSCFRIAREQENSAVFQRSNRGIPAGHPSFRYRPRSDICTRSVCTQIADRANQWRISVQMSLGHDSCPTTEIITCQETR